MKTVNILGVHWKIRLLEGGSRKTNIEGGGAFPKKGGSLDSLLILGGLGKKEGGGVFHLGRGVDTPMHIMWLPLLLEILGNICIAIVC